MITVRSKSDLEMQAPFIYDTQHLWLEDSSGSIAVRLELDGYLFRGTIYGQTVEFRPGADIDLGDYNIRTPGATNGKKTGAHQEAAGSRRSSY